MPLCYNPNKGGLAVEITNKIKSLLALYGLAFADYSRKLNIKPQSLHTKAKANAYKINDLLHLADLTGTRLAFIDKDNKPVMVFELEDLEE